MQNTYELNTDLTAEQVETTPEDRWGAQSIQIPVAWNHPAKDDDNVDFITSDKVLFYGFVREREGDTLIVEVGDRSTIVIR